MTPEQAARRWREAKIARQRRDVELETFPTTAGSRSKNAHPMFGQRQPLPTKVRLPGLARRLPAPGGLTTWGTILPAAIEHVGGGYHLVSCVVVSEDAGWWDAVDGRHTRWSIGIWLIRPDSTISDPWLSDGNTFRTTTSCYTFDTENAPPFGEPNSLSTPKLTRWQEGALLSFTAFTEERQYVADLSSFWPQCSGTDLDVPFVANVYRWVGHDTVDPVVGPAFELYAGGDDDFPTDGEWDTGGGATDFDDATIEGVEVIGPSADPNIAILGLAANSGRQRAWLLDKDPSDNTLSLAQRTTLGDTNFGASPRLGNPGGLTRIAVDRWLTMSSLNNSTPGMWAALIDAKTGSIVDTVTWDDGGTEVDCYFIVADQNYYAGNHLHWDGNAAFAGWVAVPTAGVLGHRHTTLTVEGDTVTAGDVVQWATESRADRGGQFTWTYSSRYVETCEGCLRLIDSYVLRQQSLFEGRRAKAGIVPLLSPEFPSDGLYEDQRTVPSSHPAGSMWAVNVSLAAAAYGSNAQVEPWLIRYPT